MNLNDNYADLVNTDTAANDQHGGDDFSQISDKALLLLALEGTSDGVWIWHVPSGSAYLGPRYYTMLGYKNGEFPANYDPWVNLLYPEDKQRTQSTIHKLLESRVEYYEVEFRLQTRSGEWLWILGLGKVIDRDDGGDPVRVAGSHVNIDSLKQAEQPHTPT